MKRLQGFVAGALVGVILAGSLVIAKQAVESADLLYRDIQIQLDGNLITPKDASGKVVEPFIIEGTTYLPVRAVGEALDLEVEWSDETNTVVLKSAAAEEEKGEETVGEEPAKDEKTETAEETAENEGTDESAVKE